MKNNPRNVLNLTIILLTAVFFILGCKDTNSSSGTNTSSNIKVIGGFVFPSNEVCQYADSGIISKYGILNLKWGKSVEGKDPNVQYYCKPLEKSIRVTSVLEETEITLNYDAWGSSNQGAYTISVEYWAKSDTKINNETDQATRANVLIPYCNEIAKKALKANLPKTIIERLQNKKRRGSPTGTAAKPFCEKLGQSYVCVDEIMEQTDNLLRFQILANNEAYQAYLK
jgi:hypothetical protein